MKHLCKFESLFDDIPLYSNTLSNLELIVKDAELEHVNNIFIKDARLYVFGGYDSIRRDTISTERELTFRFAIAASETRFDINLNYLDNYLVFDDDDERPFEDEFNTVKTCDTVVDVIEYIEFKIKAIIDNWLH